MLIDAGLVDGASIQTLRWIRQQRHAEKITTDAGSF